MTTASTTPVTATPAVPAAPTAGTPDPADQEDTNVSNGLNADPEVLERSKSKVSAAKVKLLLKSDLIFFSSILLKLPIRWVTNIKTACTNGRSISFNPNFVETLTAEETVFVLMHELKHVILKHMGRLHGRDPRMWNIACDYVINYKLVELGFKMPAKCLYDAQYGGMSADTVYFKLMQDHLDNPGKSLPDPDHVDLDPNEDLTDADSEAIDDLINSGIMAANEQGSKAIGNVPADLLRRYEEMMNPKVPWQTLLNRFLFGVSKSDYSMRKPNRRYLARGYCLPSLHSDSMDHIDFAIDTSGSVSGEMMQTFVSEIAGVFKKFSPERIGIMQFDHDLKSRDVIKSVEDFKKITFKGGGGTDVLPVLEQFKQNEAKALVIITDGYFHHDKSWNPKKPVIWVVYDNPGFIPPFGKVAHFYL